MENFYVRRIRMTEAGKHMSKLEQQLNATRQKGATETSMRLSEEQATFVKEVLKLKIIPCLYEIQTRRITNASTAMSIIRDVHRANKRGQRTIRKDLRQKEVRALERAGVEFRPVKYRIIFKRG